MPKKLIAEMVSAFLKKNGLNQAELARKGHLSAGTVNAALKGEYDKDPSKLGGRKKTGIAGSIARLAIACEEDAESLLKSLGLEYHDTVALTTSNTRTAVLEQAMSISIGQDDLDYLSTVLKGLKQPLTIRVAVELLKLRSTTAQ